MTRTTSGRPARRGRRVPAAFGVAGVTGPALAVLLALPAAAHVSVGADDTTPGATDTVLTLRVPNEADDATTVKVEVTMPSRTPLASVLPEPVAGWTVATTKVTFSAPIGTDDGTITEGVGKVTWTAAPGTKGVPVGGFQAFRLLVGPLPKDADALSFPTVQTYSDGDVSRWVEPAVPGAPEPESPAPRLDLGAARAGSAAGGTGAVTDSGSGSAGGDGQGADGGTPGLAGLLLGGLGAVLGGLALVRSGRRPDGPGAATSAPVTEVVAAGDPTSAGIRHDE